MRLTSAEEKSEVSVDRCSVEARTTAGSSWFLTCTITLLPTTLSMSANTLTMGREGERRLTE